ncbi:MAG: class I SAM-dependent methyltransferase [Terrimicrobiaceae bacterium]|nr:class I SAM-dependent methyltransferase [Terrimicrobiaceae bacterium]
MTPESPPLERSPYDELEYIAASFPRMNPARIGAVGQLFGMRPAPAARCRMLELGCGQGFTLLALAQLFPESEFLGIDLAERHVANARRLAAAAGLTNVRFEQRDILDVSAERDGKFDYIASHGVYSWVPAPVKEHLLAVCGSQLEPQGMAYISYNTLPGWAHLRVVREMLIYHTSRYADPMEKHAQARTLVAFLRETAPGGKEGWLARWLAEVEKLLARSEPAYFIHEYLETTNDPCYFHEFMERAEAHGLKYVSEAAVAQSFPTNLGQKAATVIEMLKRSVVDAEQYMDFARNTQFRTTLLARSDVLIDRNFTTERLARLRFAMAIRPVDSSQPSPSLDGTQEFVSAGGARFSSREPFIQAVLRVYSQRPGQFLGLPAVRQQALESLTASGVPHPAEPGVLLGSLLSRCLAAGIAEAATSDATAFETVDHVTERPFATPLSRVQADAGLPVLQRDLVCRKLSEDARAIVAWCDGGRSADDILRAFDDAIRTGRLYQPPPQADGKPTAPHELGRKILEDLAKGGFLWQLPAAPESDRTA